MIHHYGLATMYDNTHGSENISIMNALSGILNNARSMGADASDCEAIRDAILTDILMTPCADIKRKLAENCYIVQIKDGYLDIGYLLSLRF